MGRALNQKADHVLANMEQLGAQTVRDLISSGRWPANYNTLARKWLYQKDMEDGDCQAHSDAQTYKDTEKTEREEADCESQILLAGASDELAHSAREAALEASKRAEEASKRAEDANKRAMDADKRAEDANHIARNAKNIAWTAATLVEQNSGSAKTTKWIAIAALVAALIAIAIPIATLFVRWPPAIETLLYIIWRR